MYVMGSLLTIITLVETPSIFTSMQAMRSAGLSATGCLPCRRWHRQCAGSLRN